MTNDQLTYDAYMMDYAAGTLSPDIARAFEVHILCSDAGSAQADTWATVRDTFRFGHKSDDGSARYDAACKLLSRDLSDVKWKRSLFGAKYAKLEDMTGRLMRLDPGKSVPAHGHKELELTVVLEGEFSDGDNVYSRGDLVIGRPGIRHKPAAHGADPCICYVVTAPFE